MGLLVRRRRRTGLHKHQAPAGSADRGLGYELLQALVGAVLPDDDDYDASLLHSPISHVAQTTTGDVNATTQIWMGAMCDAIVTGGDLGEHLHGVVKPYDVRGVRRG